MVLASPCGSKLSKHDKGRTCRHNFPPPIMHKTLSLVPLPTLAVPNFALTLTLFVTPLSQPTPTDADLLLQMACPKQCPPISYPNVPVFFTNPFSTVLTTPALASVPILSQTPFPARTSARPYFVVPVR